MFSWKCGVWSTRKSDRGNLLMCFFLIFLERQPVEKISGRGYRKVKVILCERFTQSSPAINLLGRVVEDCKNVYNIYSS